MMKLVECVPNFSEGRDLAVIKTNEKQYEEAEKLLRRAIGMDPDHPAYDAEKDAPFADVVPRVYEEMDGLVSYALDHLGDDTLLIVMSDHGFTSWRRTFNLNAWLHQNGYLAVKDETLPEGMELFQNVDWSGTRAYGIGLNGLYVNVAGRERDGVAGARADRGAGAGALLSPAPRGRAPWRKKSREAPSSGWAFSNSKYSFV